MASNHIPSRLGKSALTMWAKWRWMWFYDCFMTSDNVCVHLAANNWLAFHSICTYYKQSSTTSKGGGDI